MIGMKVRYGVSDMNLKISNVTLPKAEDSYVLITASDRDNNEIAFALSHDQAELLENELFEANRRRREHSLTATARNTENDEDRQMFGHNGDQFSH